MPNQHQKKTILTYNLLLLLLTFLVNTNLYSQIFGNTRNERIYFGTDVFMPALQNKNDLKFSISSASYGSQFLLNTKIAYAAFHKFGIKYNFRTHQRDKFFYNFTTIKEHCLAIGYFGFIERKNYNRKNKLKQQNRQLWKNEWRKARAKKLQRPTKIRNLGFLFDAYVSYQTANLQHIIQSRNGTQNVNIISQSTIIQRLNLDFTSYLILTQKFDISYNLRRSAIHFKKIYLSNPYEELDNTNDLIEINNPFMIWESNVKFNLNLKYINLYLKINDVIGNRNAASKYSSIVQNTSTVLGLSFNIDHFFNHKNN